VGNNTGKKHTDDSLSDHGCVPKSTCLTRSSRAHTYRRATIWVVKATGVGETLKYLRGKTNMRLRCHLMWEG